MGGDVFEVLEEQGALGEEDAAVVMNNLLACINYCHRRNLVHRDLKPENILLDSKRTYGDLKVIDFGLACYTEYLGDEIHGLVGSAYYVSPQVITGTYTNKCDLWSCGVIAYALLSGFAPFDASTDAQVLDLVYEGRFDFDDPEWDPVSDMAKDFIAYLLSYDEKDRPTAEAALQHPWLKRCRQSHRMNNALVRSNSRDSLRDLSKFESKANKLKQAVCAIIASHLLTKQEKALVDDAFRALDKTCSGQISKRDLNSSLNDLFRPDSDNDDDDSDDDDSHQNNGLKVDGSDNSNGNEHSHSSTAELVDNIFEQVNFSGSGAIQYSEFSVVMILEKNLVTDDKLRAAFKFFDKKDKGYIVKEDLAPILKLGNRACHRIIQENASNRSKDRISFDDFKKCVLPERKKPVAQAVRHEKQASPVREPNQQLKFKGLLGGPMDESSRRQRPLFLDESLNRRGSDGGGRPMDESSRRQPLHRSNRRRDSVTAPIDASKRGHLEKLPE